MELSMGMQARSIAKTGKGAAQTGQALTVAGDAVAYLLRMGEPGILRSTSS